MSDRTLTPPAAADNANYRGLTTAEAQARLEQSGPNAVAEEKVHPLRQFLRRFWAPIPWLLEATIIIQLFLGEQVEAAVIAGLLVLNAPCEKTGNNSSIFLSRLSILPTANAKI